MTRNPLPVLRRLQRIRLDATRRRLAESLRAEAAAAARLATVEQDIADEGAQLLDQPQEQRDADAHAGWLAGATAARQDARADAGERGVQTGAARDALAEANAANQLLDVVTSYRAAQDRVIATRGEQSELDAATAGRRVERVTGIEPA